MSDSPVLLKSIRSHFLGGVEAVAGGVPVSYTHLTLPTKA